MAKKKRLGYSFPELSLYYYIKRIFDDAVHRGKIDINNKKYEPDIYIPSIKVAVEYDGSYWHKDKVDIDNEKNRALNNVDIFVIRIREKGLPKLKKFNGIVFGMGKKENDCSDDIYFFYEICIYSDLIQEINNYYISGSGNNIFNKNYEKMFLNLKVIRKEYNGSEYKIGERHLGKTRY